MASSSDALAQSIDVTQNLSFGEFAVRNNTSVYSMTMQPDGDITGVDASSGFMSVNENGVNGILHMEGFDPSADISVTITFNSNNPVTITCTPGPHFTVSAFTPVLDSGMVHTDAFGDADIPFGATISTTGLGGSYGTGGCTGDMIVTLLVSG